MRNFGDSFLTELAKIAGDDNMVDLEELRQAGRHKAMEQRDRDPRNQDPLRRRRGASKEDLDDRAQRLKHKRAAEDDAFDSSDHATGPEGLDQ